MQPILEINYTIADECDWSVGYGYKGYGYVIKRPGGGVVCNVAEGLRPEEAALARLLSATPDLLFALKQAEKVLRYYTAEDPAAYTAQEKIHAAIAKATGLEAA
jgi:hypothetical protein